MYYLFLFSHLNLILNFLENKKNLINYNLDIIVNKMKIHLNYILYDKIVNYNLKFVFLDLYYLNKIE